MKGLRFCEKFAGGGSDDVNCTVTALKGDVPCKGKVRLEKARPTYLNGLVKIVSDLSIRLLYRLILLQLRPTSGWTSGC